MKYTLEVLSEAVKNNVSIIGVLRTLGVSESSGGMHYHITTRIKQLGIDTSHFKGIRTNSGENHKGGTRRNADEILMIRQGGLKEHLNILRRALKEIGRPELCELCGIGVEWNNKPLILQIDHKNGNNRDNRPENVRFVCPNCHTQTPNHSRIKSHRKIKKCGSCGVEIGCGNKSGMCHKCVCATRRK
jgi:hypothetical protein